VDRGLMDKSGEMGLSKNLMDRAAVTETGEVGLSKNLVDRALVTESGEVGLSKNLMDRTESSEQNILTAMQRAWMNYLDYTTVELVCDTPIDDCMAVLQLPSDLQ